MGYFIYGLWIVSRKIFLRIWKHSLTEKFPIQALYMWELYCAFKQIFFTETDWIQQEMNLELDKAKIDRIKGNLM